MAGYTQGKGGRRGTRGKRWGCAQPFTKPDGSIHRSQMVTTFGPGAMVDLVDHAVLVSGLDFWSFDPQSELGAKKVIHEQRLRDSLVLRGLELDENSPFCEPPAGDDSLPTKQCGVQVLEFPRWFVCQNPDCRALVRSNGLELKGGRYRHQCDRKVATECVPVRFVMACTNGHLEDLNWVGFAHLSHEGGRCSAPSLQLFEGTTGDFSEIVVECACGASQKLKSALVTEANPLCGGQRPWLGPEGKEDCTERLRLLVRTASNSYFSQVVSALTVPDPSKELHDAIRQVWDILQNANAETLPVFRTIDKVKAAIAEFADTDVLGAIGELNHSGPAARDPLRTLEYNQFISQKPEGLGDRPGPDDLFYARSYVPPGGLPAKVGKLVVAHKLREVRAQVGFTRLQAATANMQGEYDLEVQSAPIRLEKRWLPATEIWGEGVFLALDEKQVKEWENRPVVQKRGKELLRGHDAWTADMKSAPPFPGVRFYLLHSLSHLLITAISLECGYAASAIRERLYCGPTGDDPTPMAAILLSTGSSGTEGTLGGLVEQGRRIRQHLARAYDLGILCSNDPVCASHSPAGEPTDRFLEGAACHGCLFVAECSCERFNRYLDRALVVPTMGHDQALAFFGERP